MFPSATAAEERDEVRRNDGLHHLKSRGETQQHSREQNWIGAISASARNVVLRVRVRVRVLPTVRVVARQTIVVELVAVTVAVAVAAKLLHDVRVQLPVLELCKPCNRGGNLVCMR
jgi:hypothetical protein